jgi:hypothetical protein
LPPADPFPIAALGDRLGSAAKAIHDRVQAPIAICAQSVLASATLAVQAHANVVLPIGTSGHAKPISNYFCSIAASGERKSACDAEAARAIREHEAMLRTRRDQEWPNYLNESEAWKAARDKAKTKGKGDRDAIKQALDDCGPAPIVPLEPVLLAPEPTFEGLCKLFSVGQPSLGLFATEGGQFIGGHGMSSESKLRTAAGLSSIWDGDAIRRVRAGDGVLVLPGRRLTAHLMAQPGVAAMMCGDTVLDDQGLLSRMLISAPESAAGTRVYRNEQPEIEKALGTYHSALRNILSAPLPLADGKFNELQPRSLPMSQDAQKLWRGFADSVEGDIGAGRPLEPIRGLANKLPEHAARIAAVLALVRNLEIGEIDEATLSDGINIAQHYAAEALRLIGASRQNPHLVLAQKLLTYLQNSWSAELVSLPDIYQRTLNAIRDKATAIKLVQTLGDHGWLVRVPDGAVIGGQRRRDVWKIVRG